MHLGFAIVTQPIKSNMTNSKLFSFFSHSKHYYRLELAIILVLAVGLYYFSSLYDFFETVVDFVHTHETWDIDEILVVAIYLVVAFCLFGWRRIVELRRAQAQLNQRMQELHQALSEVRQLQGIIPICASCKKIRDDQGYWHGVEAYIHEHSGADFSHGICPSCRKTYYSWSGNVSSTVRMAEIK